MKTWIAIACTIGLGVSAIQAASPPDPRASAIDARAADTGMLERFLNSGAPTLTSYRARRVLTASTMGGRMSAFLEAMTSLAPDGTFSFEVIRQDGSALIRSRVLLAALEAERLTRNEHQLADSALTTANYEFRMDQVGPKDGMATVRLFPRRQTPMLLSGTVTVRQHDGDMVRIDGSPSASPSWWTKEVYIVRRYARIAGVRVPMEMASRADVRVAGESTFWMVYEYQSINGRAVSATAASAASPRHGNAAGETGTGPLW